jgi:hypothetical protein
MTIAAILPDLRQIDMATLDWQNPVSGEMSKSSTPLTSLEPCEPSKGKSKGVGLQSL